METSKPYLRVRFLPHLAIASNKNAGRVLGHSKATLRMAPQDAARYYLQEFFRENEEPEFRSLAGETPNNRAPNFRVVAIHEQSQLGSRIVKFIETRNSIPIYGSNLVVELDQNQELKSITGKVTRVEDVDAVAKFSSADALESLKKFTDSHDLQAPDPEANYYYTPEKKWRLVYLFRDVPASPRNWRQDSEQRAAAPSSDPSDSPFEPRFNYMVDAQDGSILEYYRERSGFSELAAKG